MRVLLLALVAVMTGCAPQTARYQLAASAASNVLWRLDTQTGDLEACGFEAGKPVCTPFPSPSRKTEPSSR
jgi:hypothetical protein